MFGGCPAKGRLADLHLFDPETSQWTRWRFELIANDYDDDDDDDDNNDDDDDDTDDEDNDDDVKGGKERERTFPMPTTNLHLWLSRFFHQPGS